MPRYYWNPQTLSYSTSRGRTISARQQRAWIDKYVDSSKARVRALSEKFVKGEITLPEWSTQVRAEIKAGHTALAEIAAGGRSQFTPSQAGRLGARLRGQYAFLDRFGLDIEQGKQKLDGTLVSRAGMYADAQVGTFEGMRRAGQWQIGMTEEMRVLGGSNHCDDCPNYADVWAPIGTLPEIGDTECLSRCRCHFTYR